MCGKQITACHIVFICETLRTSSLSSLVNNMLLTLGYVLRDVPVLINTVLSLLKSHVGPLVLVIGVPGRKVGLIH